MRFARQFPHSDPGVYRTTWRLGSSPLGSTLSARLPLRPWRYRGGVDLTLLERTLADRGEPPFRARQVWEWAARGAGGYDEMTNLPLTLRARLAESVPFSSLSVEDEATAADGTVKALFRSADGHPVEAVLMRYRDGGDPSASLHSPDARSPARSARRARCGSAGT